MDFSRILEHMNSDHEAEMIALCKKFAPAKEVKHVRLEGVDFEGLDLVYDGKKLRIEFPQKASPTTIEKIIVDLCMSAIKTLDYQEVQREIEDFKQGFGSVVLASSNGDMPMASYAPLIQLNHQNYIYISATAQHFDNIKNHPDKLEVMFLEDECKAKSIILRKRLRYKAKAQIIERGSQEFDQVLDKLESSGANGVKTIRSFSDFYLIKLTFLSGRFVKGFGQAYRILDSGEIEHIGSSGNPHQNPHTKKPIH